MAVDLNANIVAIPGDERAILCFSNKFFIRRCLERTFPPSCTYLLYRSIELKMVSFHLLHSYAVTESNALSIS